MAVDFAKAAHILTVHGIEIGENDDIDGGAKIEKLVRRNLELSHLTREFEVGQYLYENINDEAQEFYKNIAKTVLSGNPLAGSALSTAIDLVGDVVTAAGATSTAGRIREGLRERILSSYDSGNQLVLVSGSLGTVYALDVVSQLIRSEKHFLGDDRSTWPVQGLVTMGSPLGLELDLGALKIFDRRPINSVEGARFEVFPWHNFFNALDPIVSGHLFGSPLKVTGAMGPVERRYGEEVGSSQWLLQGHRITSGKQWMLAHSSYWKNPKIGGKIVDLLWG